MNVPFLFIGAPEVFVIMLIVVMVFGADKIPEIARGLGKGMRQIKDATNDIKKEINDSAKDTGLDKDIVKEITNGTSDEFKRVQKDVNKIKDGIDDFTGPIKRSR